MRDSILSGQRRRRGSAWGYLALLLLLIVPAVGALFTHPPAPGVLILTLVLLVGLGLAVFVSVTAREFRLSVSIFWTWAFIFLGLAPAYQIAANAYPWGGRFGEETIIEALTVILIGCAVTAIAASLISRWFASRRLRSLPASNVFASNRRMTTFLRCAVGVQIAVSATFAVLMGSALFEGRAVFSQRLTEIGDAVPGGGSLYFLATAGALVLPALVIVAVRNGSPVGRWWTAASAVVGFIVTNPLIGSRFLSAGYFLAMIAAIVLGRGIVRLLPAGITLVMVTIFPNLDVLRGDGTGARSLALSLPSDTLRTPDFDAFEMLVREVSLRGSIPSTEPTSWQLLLAPFLRWIPGLSRAVQGDISGPTVARSTGMSWTNVSMPLWGEAHLTGGLIGVIVAFVLLGWLLIAVAQPFQFARTPAGLQKSAIAEPAIAALIFIVLRGSLYEVLDYLLFAAVIWLVLRRLRSGAALAADPVEPRTVAFYLPQFHTIPENDAWWGEGFTEWRNVDRAVGAFDGHEQPRQVGELGRYDLSDVSVMHGQADLARANGVDAFCFYFYWFDGKRLLETPLDNFIAQGPDMPFCVSWANENWSRRWDGKERDLLIAQRYEPGTAEAVFDDFLPYLRDPRYLRVDDAAVLLIHRVDHLPLPAQFAEVWRRRARETGIGELHLVAAETKPGIRPDRLGMDALCDFPPVGSNTLATAELLPTRNIHSSFRGRLMSYSRMARRFGRRAEPDFVRYRGVAPSWDNSARRGDNATIYVGSTPSRYASWLSDARRSEQLQRAGSGLIFINAWNEWAEGAYLEPDGHHGRAYLDATRKEYVPQPNRGSRTIGAPSRPWLHSLALAAAGSAVNAFRLGKSALASLRGPGR